MKAAVTFIIALLYLIIAVSVGYLVAQTAPPEGRGSTSQHASRESKAFTWYCGLLWPLALPLVALVVFLVKNGLVIDDSIEYEEEDTQP